MGIPKKPDELAPSALTSLIERYRTKGVTEGGQFSLAELLVEQRRRRPSALPINEVARFIIDRSRSSSDGLVTYKEIWDHFRPGEDWKGHGSQGVVKDALYRVIGYCAAHGLPILTTLVVRTQSRQLSDEAIENIYRECKEFGVDVGLDPREFVQREADRSRTAPLGSLPPDF